MVKRQRKLKKWQSCEIKSFFLRYNAIHKLIYILS
jgi:hypothetical protein